jgi:hypothetical protein
MHPAPAPMMVASKPLARKCASQNECVQHAPRAAAAPAGAGRGSVHMYSQPPDGKPNMHASNLGLHSSIKRGTQHATSRAQHSHCARKAARSTCPRMLLLHQPAGRFAAWQPYNRPYDGRRHDAIVFCAACTAWVAYRDACLCTSKPGMGDAPWRTTGSLSREGRDAPAAAAQSRAAPRRAAVLTAGSLRRTGSGGVASEWTGRHAKFVNMLGGSSKGNIFGQSNKLEAK